MYYKIIKDGRVIDVLDRIIYVRWQEKHQIPLLCSESRAQGVLSSDERHIWHIDGLLRFPDGCQFDSAELEPIDKFEYDQLRILHGKTADEIIDGFVLSLLEEGVL